jgi:hypothetical protein
LDLELPDVHELIQLLGRAPGLKTLKLNKPLLRDEDLELLLETVRPDQLRNVEIQDCDVSDDAVETICKYVENGSVMTFIVNTDQFTSDSQQAVNDAVASRIEKVTHQNKKLKAGIQCLRDYATSQSDGKKTIAVGPGAQDFNEYLEDLLRSVQELNEPSG